MQISGKVFVQCRRKLTSVSSSTQSGRGHTWVPTIPVLRKVVQEDHKFRVSLKTQPRLTETQYQKTKRETMSPGLDKGTFCELGDLCLMGPWDHVKVDGENQVHTCPLTSLGTVAHTHVPIHIQTQMTVCF